MRKIYLFVAAAFVGATSFGQTTTTITSHFEQALTTSPPSLGLYSWQSGNGYVSGTNAYGDLGALQLFDNGSGVTGAGTIDSLKIMIRQKTNTTGTASVVFGVWENNGGNPGTLLASQTVNLTDIDTSQAGYQLIGFDGTSAKGLYNVGVGFATPVAIPANNSFFAGVMYPLTASAGDTIAILTTTDGTFVDTVHAGVMSSTGSFYMYSNDGIKIENAIFPTITVASVNVADVIKAQTRLYPNPATDVVNIDFGSSTVKQVNVLNLNGQLVLNNTVDNGTSSLDVSNLDSGLYIYQAVDAEGAVLFTDKFSKK